jgi:CO dehydrogenase/acetyl-CoA synthase beta subunit
LFLFNCRIQKKKEEKEKEKEKEKEEEEEKNPKKHIKTCYEIHSYSIVGTGNATGIKKHIFVGLVNSQETFAR